MKLSRAFRKVARKAWNHLLEQSDLFYKFDTPEVYRDTETEAQKTWGSFTCFITKGNANFYRKVFWDAIQNDLPLSYTYDGVWEEDGMEVGFHAFSVEYPFQDKDVDDIEFCIVAPEEAKEFIKEVLFKGLDNTKAQLEGIDMNPSIALLKESYDNFMTEKGRRTPNWKEA